MPAIRLKQLSGSKASGKASQPLPYKLSSTCPACGVFATKDLRSSRLVSPVFGDRHTVPFDCSECPETWGIVLQMTLDVSPVGYA